MSAISGDTAIASSPADTDVVSLSLLLSSGALLCKVDGAGHWGVANWLLRATFIMQTARVLMAGEVVGEEERRERLKGDFERFE